MHRPLGPGHTTLQPGGGFISSFDRSSPMRYICAGTAGRNRRRRHEAPDRMKPQTVLKLAVVAGLLLALWSFGVHHHFMTADEAQVRLACRSLCTLGAEQRGAGVASDDAARLALSFSGTNNCGALSDDAPALVGCRDALLAAGISVSDYHCLADAESLSEANGCDPIDSDSAP